MKSQGFHILLLDKTNLFVFETKRGKFNYAKLLHNKVIIICFLKRINYTVFP